MKINKPRRRSFSIIFIVVLIILVLCATYFFYSVKATLPTASLKLSYPKSLTQKVADPVWPEYGSGAVGAIGFDGVLTKHGNQSPRPIASITKVITALLVLQAKPLNDGENGPNIELTQADLDIYNRELSLGAAVQPVNVGSSMTERQALEAMLLPSAANYSVTLAIWAYGSIDNYLDAVNVWLTKNNLKETTIVDTSGLASEDVSSPSDLVEIGKLALANPTLASIVATKQITISDLGTISNTNRLLGQSGVNGIKTGTTSEAGSCLLFSSVISVGNKNVTIVGDILGGENRGQEDADVIKLIGSLGSAFHFVKLASRNQQFGVYKTDWGQTAKLISDKDVDTIVWSNTDVSLNVKADKFTFANSGDQKGTLVINIGNKVINQPLIVDSSITDPGTLWRLTHYRWNK